MPASPKPERGTFTAERRSRRKATDADERANKLTVRKRDIHCRWPGCGCRRDRLVLEVAHLVPKSLGGSSGPENMVLLCSAKHRGTPSLHSQDLWIEPVGTARGANGPCAFYRRLHDGSWVLEGVEA